MYKMSATADQSDVLSRGWVATVSNILCLVMYCLLIVFVGFNV